ncbi:MAG: hypothetical protein DMD79_02190 [Candidatus Rokuibacteriota bacterium]|nr:MAG: hypothetical protein DMD79_02190 [Candidatus Rokubacteria bacterium]
MNRGPGLRTAVTALVLAGIGSLMIRPIEDPDLWWLLRAGRYMVETRSFPTTDPFSYTAAGAPWINHTWGFELVVYAVYGWAGTTGLILFQAVLTVAVFGVLFGVLRREGTPWGAALSFLVLAAVATHGFWRARPQLVSYFFLVVFWGALREYRAGGRDRRAWLPLLMLLWVNLHGGFLMGLALIGLCLVGELVDALVADPAPADHLARARGLAKTLGACLVAALVNPFHYRAILFPLQVVGDTLALSYISEWASLPFRDPQVVILEAFVAAFLLLALVNPTPLRPSDLGIVMVFVHLGLQASRNAPLLLIVLLPVLGSMLGQWLKVAPRRRWPIDLSWRMVASWRGWPPAGVVDRLRPTLGVADVFPAGATAYLRSHALPGRLLNEYIWGGYLIWSLYPDYRVAIDGRAAVYGPRRFGEHVIVVDLHPGWRGVLDRLGADVAVLRSGSPLVRLLEASGDWQPLYADPLATLLQRRVAR